MGRWREFVAPLWLLQQNIKHVQYHHTGTGLQYYHMDSINTTSTMKNINITPIVNIGTVHCNTLGILGENWARVKQSNNKRQISQNNMQTVTRSFLFQQYSYLAAVSYSAAICPIIAE